MRCLDLFNWKVLRVNVWFQSKGVVLVGSQDWRQAIQQDIVAALGAEFCWGSALSSTFSVCSIQYWRGCSLLCEFDRGCTGCVLEGLLMHLRCFFRSVCVFWTCLLPRHRFTRMDASASNLVVLRDTGSLVDNCVTFLGFFSTLLLSLSVMFAKALG